jgi:hypothetical protein
MPLGSFRLNALGKRLIPSFAPVVATGGTVNDITVDGINYRTHRFTASGTFSVSSLGALGTVDILLVGGGSGGRSGNSNSGTGGGAGGVLRRHYNNSILAQNYTITVGTGGDPNTVGGASTGLGYTAAGGTQTRSRAFAQFTGENAQGRDNADFKGGVMLQSFSSGAGGAGAGGQGLDANSGASSGGGPGAGDNNFTSSLTYYGGGGGAGNGSATGQAGGPGGIGGGGHGYRSNFTVPSGTSPSGQANSGGGGGGGVQSGPTGSGGSGIVIIRYRLS